MVHGTHGTELCYQSYLATFLNESRQRFNLNEITGIWVLTLRQNRPCFLLEIFSFINANLHILFHYNLYQRGQNVHPSVIKCQLFQRLNVFCIEEIDVDSFREDFINKSVHGKRNI